MQISVINEWLANDFTRAFSWTLIHSLWQGLAAAIVAGVIIFCTKRSTAALRYNMLSGVFVLFIATACITFFTKYNAYNEAAAVTPQASAVTVETSANTSYATPIIQPFYKRFSDSIGSYFDQNAPLVVLIWFMVFVVQCLKLCSGLYYIQRLRSRGLAEPAEEWKEKLEALCSVLGIRQSVLFMQSHLVKMPVVVGYLKPIILVPTGMLNNLPVDQVETILLHELAHIRRKDYGVNLLQSFAETVFFFNPAIRWISTIIREEREACCDDIVVAYTSNKTTYLQALVNFSDQTTKVDGYAMALAHRQTSMLNRVKRMLNYENNKLNIMEKVILLSGLVVFTAFGVVNAKETRVMKAPAIVSSTVSTQAVISEADASNTVALPAAMVTPKQAETNKLVEAPVDEDTTRKTKKPNYRFFISTSRNTEDKSNGEFIDIVVQDENGNKTYKAKKVNNKITEFYVNDVRVADADLGKYKQVIDQAEEALQRGEEARIRGEEARVRGEEARKRGEEARKRGEESRKHGEEAMVRGEQARKRGEEAILRGEEARKRGEEARIRGEEARVRGEEDRKIVSDIVDELVQEKVITDRENLKFTLSNTTLEVNGIKQSTALHNKLKKFVKEGDEISYSSSGSSTDTRKSTSIKRN
jgi:beta-lactamase regulating signal transducer with metallopeptidase domain